MMPKLDIEKLRLTEDEAEQAAVDANTFVISEYEAVANAQFAKLAWGLRDYIQATNKDHPNHDIHNSMDGRCAIAALIEDIDFALETADIPRPE